MRDNPWRLRFSSPGFFTLSMVTFFGAFYATSSLAQGSLFTYQGRLTENGAAASGLYDLQFTLFNTNSGGAPVAGPLTAAPVSVSNGLFQVTLDFGASTFDGGNRWLQIGVRTNGSAASYTPLNPRQAITPAPYAITAGHLSAGALTGSLTNNSGPNTDAVFSETGIDRSATNAQTFAFTNSGGGALSLLVKSEVRAGPGSAASPSFSFIANTNTGAFNPASNALAFATGGNERMRISNTGAAVTGNLSVGGFLTLSNSAVSVGIGSTINPTASFMIVNASTVVTLSATTAIADGPAPGTLLILQGTSDVNTVTVPDSANTRLAGARILGDRDTLTLIYNGTEWVEIAYANN